MTPDLHADDAALGALADGLQAAAAAVGALAGSLPAGTDGGQATPIVVTVLSNLLTGAGELTDAAAALAAGVHASAAAYRGTETAVRDGFRAAPR